MCDDTDCSRCIPSWQPRKQTLQKPKTQPEIAIVRWCSSVYIDKVQSTAGATGNYIGNNHMDRADSIESILNPGTVADVKAIKGVENEIT